MQILGEWGSLVAGFMTPLIVILLCWIARTWSRMVSQMAVLSVRLKDQNHRLERLEDRFNHYE